MTDTSDLFSIDTIAIIEAIDALVLGGARVTVDTSEIFSLDTLTIIEAIEAVVIDGGVITFAALTDGDTTPDIAGGSGFVTANTTATTITNFDNPSANGQLFYLAFADSNTTIQSNGNIKLQGGLDFTGVEYDVLTLLYNGTEFTEVSRSLNS